MTDVDDGRLHCLQLLADGRIQAQWNSKTVNYCRSVKISPRNAKADPGAIWLSPQYTLVTLSGVDQLGVALSDELEFAFVETGRRPLDVVGLGRRAFVVNMLDDSVTVIDLEKSEAIQTISLGQTPELTMPQQGE